MATHSVHTASAGPRVSPSAPHHPLLIHASPPPPLHAPAPLLLFPLCAGVAAPPSTRRSWPSLPSSTQQQPSPPIPPRGNSRRQLRCSSCHALEPSLPQRGKSRRAAPPRTGAAACPRAGAAPPFLSLCGSSRLHCSSMRWRRLPSLSLLASTAAHLLLVPPRAGQPRQCGIKVGMRGILVSSCE